MTVAIRQAAVQKPPRNNIARSGILPGTKSVKRFRAWDVDQAWLLPPSVQELVPENHLAHFVRNTVREHLDLTEIYAAYSDSDGGRPPFHPAMMVALLLYAYATGVYSSRRIARACEERVDFMAVTAQEKPDFRTISLFRKTHLKALGELFQQASDPAAARVTGGSRPSPRDTRGAQVTRKPRARP